MGNDAASSPHERDRRPLIRPVRKATSASPLRAMFARNYRRDTASRREGANHLQVPRGAGVREVVAETIDDRFVEDPLVTVRLQIQLQRLQLDASLVRHVA